MTPFHEQFSAHAQDIRMTSAERSRVRMALLSHMGHDAVSVPSPFTHLLFARPLAFAFAAIIVIGLGGTAYAADGALPGDLLYSVKVGVNEPVSGALAFTDEAKAKWNADVAEERLTEAQALAENGDLTATTSSELAANFSEHANAVLALADTDTSDENVPAQFSSSVARHSAAILAAGKRSNNEVALQASGSLVVNVTSQNTNTDDAAPTTANAVMMKASVTSEVAQPKLMMFSVIAPSPEDLGEQAHEAFADATSTVATSTLSDDDEVLLAGIENRLVKADAESAIGDTDAAATDYQGVIDDLASFTASLETGNDADAGDANDSDSEDDRTPQPE